MPRIILTLFFAAVLCVMSCSYNGCGVPTEHAPAVIASKHHTNAWIETIVHKSGSVSWVQIINHPDTWTVTVQMDQESDSITVPRHVFDALNIGDQIVATFGRGRLSGKIIVREISPTPKALELSQ